MKNWNMTSEKVRPVVVEEGVNVGSLVEHVLSPLHGVFGVGTGCSGFLGAQDGSGDDFFE